jgi:hypothetical protein
MPSPGVHQDIDRDGLIAQEEFCIAAPTSRKHTDADGLGDRGSLGRDVGVVGHLIRHVFSTPSAIPTATV